MTGVAGCNDPWVWQDAANREKQVEACKIAEMKWLVVPVHAVVDGLCTCGRRKCSSRGKHPVIWNWPDSGRDDPYVVAGLWRTDLALVSDKKGGAVRVGPPTAPNVGVLTGTGSGLVILDIDPRNFGDESLFDLEQKYGLLPETVQVLTGGGGIHYYFAAPEGLPLASKPLVEGVDLKAERGIVVGPGSVHASGGLYMWEVAHHPDDVPLAPLPDWVVNMASTVLSAYPRQSKKARAVSPELQTKFVELWREVGLEVDPSTERMYCCPFHDDNTPSLSAHPTRGLWHCFGCGAQGGVKDLAARVGGSVAWPRRVLPALDEEMSQEVSIEEEPLKTCWDIWADLGIPHPSTWPIPPPPKERCGGYGQFNERRAQPGHLRAMGMLCRTLDCKVCGPYRADNWEKHLLDRFLASHGALRVLLVLPENWDTARKAIQREDDGCRDYVHFDLEGTQAPLGDATQVVVTTSAHQGLPVPYRDAFDLFRSLIRATPLDHDRISASSGWQQVNTKPPKSGEWRRVCAIQGTLEASARAATRLGLQPTPIRPLRSRADGTSSGEVWARGFDVDLPEHAVRSAGSGGWITSVLAWAYEHDDAA